MEEFRAANDNTSLSENENDIHDLELRCVTLEQQIEQAKLRTSQLEHTLEATKREIQKLRQVG